MGRKLSKKTLAKRAALAKQQEQALKLSEAESNLKYRDQQLAARTAQLNDAQKVSQENRQLADRERVEKTKAQKQQRLASVLLSELSGAKAQAAQAAAAVAAAQNAEQGAYQRYFSGVAGTFGSEY